MRPSPPAPTSPAIPFPVYTGSSTMPSVRAARCTASIVASVTIPYPAPNRSWSMSACLGGAAPRGVEGRLRRWRVAPRARRGRGGEPRHDLVEVGAGADVDAEHADVG